MLKETKNPFRWKGPLLRNECTHVVRTRVLDQVVRLLQAGEYVQVIGPHQSGRTTLAFQLVDYLVDEPAFGFMPVLISCGGLLAGNTEAFIDAAAGRLKEVGVAYDQSLFVSTLDRWLGLRSSNPWYDLQKALAEAGKNLGGSAHRGFVLILDELETISAETVRDALSFFRGLFEGYSPTRTTGPYRVVIMATRDMQCWDLKNRSPFNISNAIRVPPFSEHEFTAMLDRDHAGKVLQHISFGDDAAATVFRESGGNPYFLQRISHMTIEIVRIPAEKKRKKFLIDHKAAISACLHLFEEGDENIKRLNHDINEEKNPEELDLCRKLIGGMVIPYRGVQTEIDRLAELGVVTDRKGLCIIPIGLYRRRITNRCYNERYSQLDYCFEDRERFLISLSSIQLILLNTKVRSDVREAIMQIDGANPKTTKPSELMKILAPAVEDYLTKNNWQIDLDEIGAYLEYYGFKPVKQRDEIVEVLSKWFSIVWNTDRLAEVPLTRQLRPRE